MRRTPALGVVLGLALATAAARPGPAESQHGAMAEAPVVPVSIGFDAVRPDAVDVLPGDTVRWTNDSVRAHTVTADDDTFDSGRLPVGAQFSRRFEGLGTFPYHCTLHPFIRGVVGVWPLLIARPSHAAAPGRPYPLPGRAALASGSPVTIEEDRGAGFGPAATAIVDADGRFVATIVPRTTATYRAVAGTDTSPPVMLVVLDRRISLTAQRGRHRLLIRTSVTPATAGAPVVLQLFLHDRFGWWPVQRGKLDARSRTRFALKLRRRVAARVLLTLPDGATPLAISRTIRLGPTR
jgi:plastocyanin